MSADTPDDRTMPFTRTIRVGGSSGLVRTSQRVEINHGNLGEALAMIGGMAQPMRTFEWAKQRARAGGADERDWNNLSLSLRVLRGQARQAVPPHRCAAPDPPRRQVEAAPHGRGARRPPGAGDPGL